MTVQELINRLNRMPADATVRLWTDHGQASMKATTITAQHFRAKERDSWMTDDGPEDVDDDHPCNVVEIGAP
jgi:hypothetical protein